MPIQKPYYFAEQDEVALVTDAMDNEIAQVFAPTKEERKEIGDLFAAAPELLKALEELLFMMHPDTFGGSLDDAKETARAAISKAKGE